ncbi:MAG TPA: DUF411 domain-containing protein [Sphingomicrobium sp.]|nr:DUF411 domain-containing protein [Sphingomicrobium sp.]
MAGKIIRFIAPLALLACAETAVAATLMVTKSATCGCCGAWIDRMKAEGFAVDVRVVEDVTPTARKLGVPDKLRSCHTSQIAGYVIEGHVPAADIRRLLATRPDAAGLSVPGMVVGSPGMEQGDTKQPYQTILFDKSGKTKVFASH